MVALGFKGDYEGARELTRRATDLDPTYFFPPFEEGWVEIQAGRVQDAILKFRKAKAIE